MVISVPMTLARIPQKVWMFCVSGGTLNIRRAESPQEVVVGGNDWIPRVLPRNWDGMKPKCGLCHLYSSLGNGQNDRSSSPLPQ
ncbi:hypothetical protein TNCV_1894721 [Trichonephila clavipes]|nr:hypothetical protein TNCV_1894721 [Trichonephila clavipes]